MIKYYILTGTKIMLTDDNDDKKGWGLPKGCKKAQIQGQDLINQS